MVKPVLTKKYTIIVIGEGGTGLRLTADCFRKSQLVVHMTNLTIETAMGGKERAPGAQPCWVMFFEYQ